MSRGPHFTSMSSGSALARARVAANLTQLELANRVSIDQGSVSRFERGAGKPTWEIAERIAAALDQTVRDFWPTLDRAVKRGRLLDTVIPMARAAKSKPPRMDRLRLAYSDDEGGKRVKHRHRPPICCGDSWCRCVELDKPETYPVFGDPALIEFAAGGANA